MELDENDMATLKLYDYEVYHLRDVLKLSGATDQITCSILDNIQFIITGEEIA